MMKAVDSGHPNTPWISPTLDLGAVNGQAWTAILWARV